MSTKEQQTEAVVEIIKAVADAIRELKRVPSGHLYARLMGHMDLDQYNLIIGLLINAGLIEKTNSHELIWKSK